MFSSVCDKVVSATAPDALETFPPRDAMPVSSSTLCCLSFVDRFLSHYPNPYVPVTGDNDNAVNARLVGRARMAGIALSADELEAIMQSAAELGGRLAAALAGTEKSKNKRPATALVSDLLAKVRGIFGNRLTCVGREIRLSRNAKAERDETLLLRQIHALKNAALETCNGEKWCIVVSSGGESLAVCSVPLPPLEEGGSCGCDFFVFDPWPRPAMKLRGSYVVKFTTVRGLQLHLLSALGEIWRKDGLPKEEGALRDFVGLSVVVSAQAREGEPINMEARRLLEDSVTRLRKAEKETAIKIKREEVEALRKALAGSAPIPSPAMAPLAGGNFGLADGVGRRQVGNEDKFGAGPASSASGGQTRWQQDTHRDNDHQLLGIELGMENADVEAIEQPKPDGGIAARDSPPGVTRISLESAVSCVDVNGQRASGEHHQLPGSHDPSHRRPRLQPPAADVSPPLTLQRSGGAGEIGWPKDGHFISPERERRRVVGVTAGMDVGDIRGIDPVGRFNDSALTSEDKAGRKIEQAEKDSHIEGIGDGSCSPLGDKTASSTSSDPFRRALLRSVEGEGLADYSKRAYSVYRIQGVIQDGAFHQERAPETIDFSALTSEALNFRPATCSPIVREAEAASPAVARSMHGHEKMPTDVVDERPMLAEENCTDNAGVLEPVQPFTPPDSPQTPRPNKGPSSEGDGKAREALGVSISNDLRVTDVSEAEEAVTGNPEGAKSPSGGFRSRLRAPRAGKALALASANAHGNVARRRNRSPVLHQGSPRDSFPPPPPTMAVLANRKEAWSKSRINQRAEENGHTGRRHEPQPTSLRASRFNAEVGSEKVGTGADSALAGTVTPSSVREGHHRTEYQHNSKEMRDDDEHSRGNMTGGALDPRTSGDCHRNTEGESSHADSPVGRPPETFTCGKDHVSAAAPAPAHSHSPQKKACRSVDTDIQLGQNDVRPRVQRPNKVPSSKGGTVLAIVAPSPPATSQREIHLDRKGGEDDVEPASKSALGALTRQAVVTSDRQQDDEAFIWFGQPDTPPVLHPSAEISDTPRVRGAEAPEREDWSSPHRQKVSEAKLLLQREVRRQRDIIERAFQAREEEGRLIKARVGAEVLQRIQALRRVASPPARQAARPSPRLVPPPPNERDLPNHTGETESAQGTAHRAVENEYYPRHSELAANASGFRPADGRVDTAATTAEAELEPDVAGNAACTGPPGALVPIPPTERAPRAVADNPWRPVGRQVGVDDSPAKRVPTPLPISFDVAADELMGGNVEPTQRVKREQLRRQERYEALRARKLVEEEERRQDRTKRRAATREAQRRNAGGSTADSPLEEINIRDTEEEARWQALPRRDPILADATSTYSGHAAGVPMSRQRPSSVGTTDSGCANRIAATNSGGHILADRNGSGGREGGPGGIRVPASGATRMASPIVRGISARSNRKLVRNAINFLCLAGGHLQKKKARALEALDSHPGSNFVVLLTHTKLLAFKGIYACSGEEDGLAERVFGLGPPQVDASMVSGFYKYNSAAREFREVHSKTLGKTTDAVSVEPTRLRRPKALAAQPTP